jgi:hypothetical protein
MDSAARTVNIAGVICGCAVGLAAVLLLCWWLWARFARPQGQHSNLAGHTSVARLVRQNTMPVPPCSDEPTETLFLLCQGGLRTLEPRIPSAQATAGPRWPSAGDLVLAEQPHHVLLSRVIHGLRHLPSADEKAEISATQAKATQTNSA